jgi:hypothetical protein
MRHAIAVIATCAVVALAGCNLREYQERMDVQTERLRILDEENRNLSDGYLQMPMIETEKKDGAKGGGSVPAWPFDIFLRPPREVGTLADGGVYQAPTRDLRLFRYKGNAEGTYSFFVAVAQIGEEKSKDGKLRPGEFPVSVFRERVRSAFFDFYRKEYKVNPSSDFLKVDRLTELTTSPPYNDRGEPLPPVKYEAAASNDKFNHAKDMGIFQVYFHHEDPRQVAIIVQFPATREKDDALAKARDMSLRSLEVVPFRVMEKRSALNRRR